MAISGDACYTSITVYDKRTRGDRTTGELELNIFGIAKYCFPARITV